MPRAHVWCGRWWTREGMREGGCRGETAAVVAMAGACEAGRRHTLHSLRSRLLAQKPSRLHEILRKARPEIAGWGPLL